MKLEILFTEMGPDSIVPEGTRLRIDQVEDWTLACPRGVHAADGRLKLADDGEVHLDIKGTPAVWVIPE
jgi:hypothetical protein